MFVVCIYIYILVPSRLYCFGRILNQKDQWLQCCPCVLSQMILQGWPSTTHWPPGLMESNVQYSEWWIHKWCWFMQLNPYFSIMIHLIFHGKSIHVLIKVIQSCHWPVCLILRHIQISIGGYTKYISITSPNSLPKRILRQAQIICWLISQYIRILPNHYNQSWS